MERTVPAVLVVDDDALVRVQVRDSLEGVALQLSEAGDGEEALTRAAEARPDLVFLDLLMPNKSGLETLVELRQRFPDTRVVILSSMDTTALVDQTLSQGAARFIAKPFHPLEIREAVRALLGV